MVARALLLASLLGGLLGAGDGCADARPPDTPQPVIANTALCAGALWRVGDQCVDARAALAPNGTLFVVDAGAAVAADENPGTAAAPWRTIGRAARQMQPGDAVLIHAGVYRETVAPPRGGTDADHRITYAAAPGERVVVTGADAVPTGWTALGDARWRRAWTFPSLPTYSDDPVFRRELVVAGGRVLRPAAGASREGTFTVDGPDTAPTAVTVHLPDGGQPDAIEIGTRERLFWPVAARPDAPCGDASQPSWLRVVGLTFVHAANRAQWGAVCAGRAHGLWERVAVAWSVGMGVDVSGADHVFRRVEASDHGQMGWGGGCARCLFEDTSARRNNWRGHDPFWEAGGSKWVGTSDSVIRRHTATDNGGPGIWLDGGNARNTIEGCRVERNEVAGIMLELDTVETLVQHNVVRGTRWREWSGSGILSQAASRNAYLHNTVTGNDGMGLWLRLDPLRRAPDVGSRVEANWIVGNAVHAEEAREIAVEAASAALVRSHTFVGNAYGRPAGDPTLVSTFFLAPTGPDRTGNGAPDYRGSDAGTWMRLSGETGARVVGPGASPPAARRSPPWTAIGAPGAPPQPWRRVGADPSRVAPLR